MSGLAVRFGIEKGFFKDEGLDVELISTQNPIEALTSKDVDIADSATTNVIVAAGKGAPLKIVSSMFRTKGPFYLIAKPGIESIEDLKGKKVGAAALGSGLDVYTQTILNKHGLSKNDVTYLANGVNDAAYASLTSGQVDATIIHEPFASLAETEGTGKILAKGWDYLRPSIRAFWFPATILSRSTRTLWRSCCVHISSRRNTRRAIWMNTRSFFSR